MLSILHGVNKGDGKTFLALSCCSSDSVNVRLQFFREVEIDHDFDVIDIDTSCGNVGGDQDVHTIRLEVVDCLLSVALLSVAVDCGGFDAVTDQHRSERVGENLRGNKNKSSFALVLLADFNSSVEFFSFLKLLELLCDSCVSTTNDSDSNEDVIWPQVILCSTLNSCLEGGRKQSSCSFARIFRWEISIDLADVWSESLIEHSVGLIQNQELSFRSVDDSLFQKVFQATRSSDDDIATLSNTLRLLASSCSTVTESRNNVGISATKLVTLVVELSRQLSRRCNNDTVDFLTRIVSPTADVAHFEVIDNWNHHRSCLPRASLCRCHQIASRSKDRNGVLLDWCWLCVLHSLQVFHYLWAQLHVAKRSLEAVCLGTK